MNMTLKPQSANRKAKIIAIFLVIVLLLPACAAPATPLSIGNAEELTFQSGPFKVVGDLRLPGGNGPFPVVLFVHGSDSADRTGQFIYLPIMERMLQAGFATFAWDKPGTGESTGNLSEPNLRHKRAQILLDAIELMKTRPDIDPQRIAAWREQMSPADVTAFESVAGLPYHLEAGLTRQQRLDPAAEERVIVDQEDADRLHAACSRAIGRLRVTLVP